MSYWRWYDNDFPGPPRHWAISDSRIFRAVWWTIAAVLAVAIGGAALAWWLLLLTGG